MLLLTDKLKNSSTLSVPSEIKIYNSLALLCLCSQVLAKHDTNDTKMVLFALKDHIIMLL